MQNEDTVPAAMQRLVVQTALRAIAAAPQRYYTRYNDDIHYDEYREATGFFSGVLPFLGNLIKIVFLTTLLLTLSVVSYLAFYHQVMPSHYAMETLYFEYTRPPTPHFKPFWRRRATQTESSNGPWASIDLFAKHSGWEAVESDTLPHQRTSNRLLNAGHPYFLETVLILPESNANLQAGMFGVHTELYASNGTQLAISRRSVRFPHQSKWISDLRKFLILLPLLVEALQEARTIIVPSFRHFIDVRDMPLQHVVVRIIPRTSQLDALPEIIGGELRIGEELDAFQELLREWFYVCLCFGTTVFSGIYFVLWLCLKEIAAAIQRRYALDEMSVQLDLDEGSDQPGMQNDRPVNLNDTAEDETQNHTERQQGSLDHPSVPVVEDDDSDQWEDLQFPESNGHVGMQGDNSSFSTPLQPEGDLEYHHPLDRHIHSSRLLNLGMRDGIGR